MSNLSGPLSSGFSGTPVPPASTLNDGLLYYINGGGVDRSLHEPDLTRSGTPTTAAGLFTDPAMSFSAAGAQGYIMNAGNYPAIQEMAGVDRTYAMWIDRNVVGQSVGLMVRGSAFPSYQFYVQTSGELVLYIGGGYIVGTIVPIGTWTHVGFTYTPGTATIFINGAKTSLPKTRTANVDANRLAYGFSPSKYYDGEIDQFCAWDRVLTDAELLELYGGGAGTEFLIP